MRPLSADTRRTIIFMLEAGNTCCKIATKLDVGRSTVSELRSQITTLPEKSVGGRPPKLTATDRRHMTRLITTGKVDTAPQLKRQLTNITNTTICTQSIQNGLKKESMVARVKAKKPLLRPRHIKQRLEFAQKYEHWTEEDWARVIWSDETKVNRLGSDGRKWVWKKSGAPLTSQHVNSTVKFGGGNVMIWGCMTVHGVGYMCRIEGRMDGSLYEEILEDHVLETVEYYGMDRENFIFQQDNDSKHKSKKAQKWFKTHNVELLDWPAQSPDLNPIEHLWVHLKKKLGEYERAPVGMLELWERVQVEWDKIEPEVCHNLIESMPRRVAEVVKAKGGHTKY